MKRSISQSFGFIALLTGVFSVCIINAGPLDDVYKLGPDSLPQDGVPKGVVIGPLTHASQVFPNTTRHYWVYVPAQYDAASPARLMVFQDL